MECIAKTMFSQKRCFGVSRVDFLCFWEGLGVRFLIFSALETGLKIECFVRSPRGSGMASQNKEMTGSMVKMMLFIRTNNLSTTSWVITLA